MHRFHQLSIQHKVTALALSSSLLVLLAASVIFIVRESGSARHEAREILNTRADIIGEALAVALDFDDPRPAQAALRRLARDPQMIGAAAYTSAGTVLAKYPPTFAPPATPPTGRRFVGYQLHLTTRVVHQGRVVGTLYLVRNTIELREQFSRTLVNFGLAALIAAGLGFLVSSALQRIVSTPILSLARTAQAVGVSHDFSVRAVKAHADEIGELVDRFNQMLAELQSRDRALAEARSQLEARVDERTRQLTQALEQLRTEARDRENTQKALQQAEGKLLLHVAQTPMAVIDWNTQFEVVTWNPAAARIFGYTATEAIGRSGPELVVPPEARPHVNEIWQALLQRTGGTHSVNNNITKDGSTLTCEWFNTPLVGTDGRVIGVSSFCADITARVSLEQQVLQSQKLQAVGQLAAGIAHDFNNELTVILGNASLLDLSPRLTKEDRVHVGQVQAASTRSATLVRQLLAFSRKQVIQPKPLDLNELIANDTKMLSSVLGEHIILRCTFAPTPARVHADRGMLDQILLNLCVNARDAMPGGGQLQISAVIVTVDTAHRHANAEARLGRFCCLSVTDTGCGMDAATQARIFEPFFTTKGVGQGTGLGLATVYGIVKQHDGWIECVSAPGLGATFKVFLPFYAAAPAAPATAPGPAPAVEAEPRGTETVLLVEDEAPVRELSRRALTRLGYQVLLAASGPEALQVWREHHATIDLLLTDLVMPGGLSGLDLAARLRQERPNLLVIYCSGYSTDLVATKMEIKEGRNFLAKPYSLTALSRIVRAALDDRAPAGPATAPPPPPAPAV
ncbi:hypothetical protein LBMAG56_09640 [Verrucomicrobiota bacterium]|nr:hypothetical protein LBMAG56_09640 [Verrucomicrobiota bacterium]